MGVSLLRDIFGGISIADRSGVRVASKNANVMVAMVQSGFGFQPGV